MKIGHPADKTLPLQPSTTSQAASADSAKAAHAPAAPTPAIGASAKVEISSTASTLLAGGSSAEFDSAKVGRISDAVAAGTFKPNPEAIADKLISNARELLGKVKPG